MVSVALLNVQVYVSVEFGVQVTVRVFVFFIDPGETVGTPFMAGEAIVILSEFEVDE
jgi:hypothetical protein